MAYGTRAMVQERLGLVDASGMADSGTTTTLVDTDRDEEEYHWVNYVLSIIEGTNEGEDRKITVFAKSTNTITVSPAFTSAIDVTSRYVITEEKYNLEIDNGLAFGDGYIDGIMAQHGSIPSPAPQLIKDICADLATYYYYKNRNPEQSTIFWDSALRMLNEYVKANYQQGVVLRTGQV